MIEHLKDKIINQIKNVDDENKLKIIDSFISNFIKESIRKDKRCEHE